MDGFKQTFEVKGCYEIKKEIKSLFSKTVGKIIESLSGRSINSLILKSYNLE